ASGPARARGGLCVPLRPPLRHGIAGGSSRGAAVQRASRGRHPCLESRGTSDGNMTNPVFSELPVSVFEVMSRLAREHDAINLGQGFPDDPGPEDVRRKAAEAVISGWNQYPPMMGIPELREAIARHYHHWQGLDLDPASEVMVTSGATEALAGSLLALIE